MDAVKRARFTALLGSLAEEAAANGCGSEWVSATVAELTQLAEAGIPEEYFGLPLNQEPKYTVNIHGRLINRETGVAIPDDEPVFILRAKDSLAFEAIAEYRRSIVQVIGHGPHHEAVKNRFLDFVIFANDKRDRMKAPTS